MKRLAVIDLGTNTFHLLIVEVAAGNTFKEVYRIRQFVKLAEEGIENIGNAPFQRGLETLKHFSELLQEYGVERCIAIGTAALRTANNGRDFIQQVKVTTGIQIELISGDREAQLIHNGVIHAVPLTETPHLIMDIGGGSVEFIIAKQSGVLWAQSFPIGVAILYKLYQENDPISKAEEHRLMDFLLTSLQPLQQALQQYPVRHLIGASGTFDVLENFLAEGKNANQPGYTTIALERFPSFYAKILSSSLEERLAAPEIPTARAEMLVVALILIQSILQLSPIQSIYVSSYALKEGMLYEMLDSL